MYKTTSVADLGYDSDIYDFFRTLDGEMETQTITPNNYWVSIDGTEATLFKTAPTGTPAESVYDDGTMVKANWNDLLEVLAPQSAGGTVAGASVDIADIPLTTGSTLQLNINSDIESTSLITGTIVRSSIDTAKLVFTVDNDTLPTTTQTDVTRIVNPESNYPGDGTIDAELTGQRYLLTNEIVGDNWGSLSADVHDIVEYDGAKWIVSFDASSVSDTHYVKNLFTNKQYKYENSSWTSTHEGQYNPGYWKLNL